jgi:hypothetical protein
MEKTQTEQYPPGIISVERVYEPDIDAQVKAIEYLLELKKPDKSSKPVVNRSA